MNNIATNRKKIQTAPRKPPLVYFAADGESKPAASAKDRSHKVGTDILGGP